MSLGDKGSRIVVIYVYHIKDANVEFFRENGIHQHPQIDYIMVRNRVDFKTKQTRKRTIIINNTRVVFLERANISIDWGAYMYGLSQINKDDYDYFVFINSTVCGPFVNHVPQENWPFIFTDRLNGKVAMCGATINNTKNTPHVQSMCFCFDHRALDVFYDTGIFWRQHTRKVDKETLIAEHEMRTGEVLFQHGYNIDCMLYCYRGRNWKQDQKWEKGILYDFWHPRAYYGDDIHPLETVFIKTNRHKSYPLLRKYIAFTKNVPTTTLENKTRKHYSVALIITAAIVGIGLIILLMRLW
jgi:hypothetical protein